MALDLIHLKAPEGFEYDLSHWPVFVQIRHTQTTVAAYQQHLHVLEGLLARHEKQVHILDIRAPGSPDRALMRMQADWNERNRELLRRNCLGVGMVIHNMLQRFGIATMLSLVKNVVPYEVFGTLEAALAWANHLKASQARVERAP